MASIALPFSRLLSRKEGVPRLCRVLIGDWVDVRDRRSGAPMNLHVALKAHGNTVLGSIHVKSRNRWLRMELSPAWFCARGTVYERRGKEHVHVATVRLCHRRKDRCVLWQVIGYDQSGCLPSEAVLWEHR